ncbi:MAG: CYTH domain-containing protein [Candidatus Taylorbacteria bacterium]|nr:CYTH domain-containing protein [Candidatus Taylorbacteria bacterium]
MIEVEKNFDLRPGDKERLIRNAEFVGRKSFTDVYYDTPNFSLTRRDYWLRTRNGKFELKVPLNQEGINSRKTDQYKELETDEEIARKLNLNVKAVLPAQLADKVYKPFATITTARETYRKGDFHLDFDETDFGFSTFEAELMVKDISEVSAAESKIIEFAKVHGISGTEAHGKVIEHIFRRNPEHYKVLLEAGVVE